MKDKNENILPIPNFSKMFILSLHDSIQIVVDLDLENADSIENNKKL